MKIKRKLSTMENLKYQTIKDVINNKISKKRAAEILQLTRKTVNRLIIKLKKKEYQDLFIRIQEKFQIGLWIIRLNKKF